MDNTETSFKCVISIGMRCFTDIFLKKLELKQFSCVFDAIYNTDISNIIYIFENEFNYSDIINTETIDDLNIKNLNKKHGYRTLHKLINYKENNLIYSYHNAFLPHHNLNDIDDKNHFDRCFKRLKNIKILNIKTLFCLFFHPDYSNDTDVSIENILFLNNYLQNNFNCHLLVCKFKYINKNYNWKTIINNDKLTYIHINNSSHIYEDNEKILKEIFDYLNINKLLLIKYNEI